MSQLPPEYDDIQPQDYDPMFTADISTKMRVPDRIIPLNGYPVDPLNGYHDRHDDIHTDEQIKNQKRAASMSVPDKIVMGDMGNDRPLPDLHKDALLNDMQDTYVGLTTPPRVLTLDDRPFPMTEVHESLKEQEEREAELDAYESRSLLDTPSPRRYNDSLVTEARMAAPGNNSLLITDEDDDDDMVIMRRQIAKISRHVLLLEDENAKRSQREVVLYPVVLGYILFRVAAWFLRRL